MCALTIVTVMTVDSLCQFMSILPKGLNEGHSPEWPDTGCWEWLGRTWRTQSLWSWPHTRTCTGTGFWGCSAAGDELSEHIPHIDAAVVVNSWGGIWETDTNRFMNRCLDQSQRQQFHWIWAEIDNYLLYLFLLTVIQRKDASLWSQIHLDQRSTNTLAY